MILEQVRQDLRADHELAGVGPGAVLPGVVDHAIEGLWPPPDGSAIVTVRGDVDTATATQLWQYLSYLVGQGHHHIVLDLRGMILIDLAEVEVLAQVASWTRSKGSDLVLRSASPAVVEQLALARRAEAHRRRPATGS